MIAPVQRHSRVGSEKYPHGQGFIAPIRMKVGWEGQRHVGARERHRRFFERLAQHFEHVARKFRQLVQEQHAVVRQADFAGPRRSGAAADQPRVRYGVMRRAKRPPRQQSDPARQQSRDAMDLRGLDRFLKRQRRQDAGESFREHGLAGARRTDHQHVVAARGSHFERALGGGLAAHVAEIRDRSLRAAVDDWHGDGRGLELIGLVQIRSPLRPDAACRTRRTPSVTAASAALSAGTSRFGMPCRRAQTAIDKTPRTGRSVPSSDNSPTSMCSIHRARRFPSRPECRAPSADRIPRLPCGRWRAPG